MRTDTANDTGRTTAPPVAEYVQALPPEYLELHWYAAYTRARHEKRVAEQLQERAVELFLPLYQAVHRWKDRQKLVEIPLFSGYVFARIALKERLSVLQIPGVVRLVGSNGHPIPLPDAEIEALRSGLAQKLRAEPHPYLTVGRRVRIRSGPLMGLEGILVRKKNKFRVVLTIELLLRSIVVDIDSVDVLPVQ